MRAFFQCNYVNKSPLTECQLDFAIYFWPENNSITADNKFIT